MNQLDAITVNDTQNRGLSHELLSPGAMRLKQAEQARPLRQSREQGLKVTLEPAVEGAITDAFDGKDEGQRDDLARMELGLAVFRHLAHPVIYPAEEFGDKVLRGHDD